MKKYIKILKNTQLFTGISDDEIEIMLGCLSATLNTYKKGDYVFRSGEHIRNLTVLVEGSLHIQKDDYWGNRTILGHVSLGEMFGESYVSPDSGAMLNDVIAVENSTVMFFDIYKLLSVCSSACRFHSLAVKNLFFAISEKNRKLVSKLGYISNRSIREKLLSYLSDEAGKNRSPSFTIPFNRQQLADYLSVDRSALSNELSKLKKEGMLDFNKNSFTLLQ